MADIPNLIQEKFKNKNIDYFLQFQMMLASNNRVMKDETYKEFVRNLTKNLENNDKNSNAEKLDHHALETLRLMTSKGANRTGGGN